VATRKTWNFSRRSAAQREALRPSGVMLRARWRCFGGVGLGAGVDDPQIGGAVGAVQTDDEVERVRSLHAVSFPDGLG